MTTLSQNENDCAPEFTMVQYLATVNEDLSNLVVDGDRVVVTDEVDATDCDAGEEFGQESIRWEERRAFR